MGGAAGELGFGSLAVYGVGAVTVAPTELGSRIASGDVVLQDGATDHVGAAGFRLRVPVRCDDGSFGMSVLLPATEALASASDSMSIADFTSSIPNNSMVIDARRIDFYVGATLHTKLGQRSGSYAGAIEVMVEMFAY